MTSMTIQELREIMTRNGLTVRRLSRRCGYSRDYIKRVLRGDIQIKKHFEQEIRELLAGGKRYVVHQGGNWFSAASDVLEKNR